MRCTQLITPESRMDQNLLTPLFNLSQTWLSEGKLKYVIQDWQLDPFGKNLQTIEVKSSGLSIGTAPNWIVRSIACAWMRGSCILNSCCDPNLSGAIIEAEISIQTSPNPALIAKCRKGSRSWTASRPVRRTALTGDAPDRHRRLNMSIARARRAISGSRRLA